MCAFCVGKDCGVGENHPESEEAAREMNQERVYKDTYQECAPKVRGHLYNQINNREDADEVFQEVFLSLWKALRKFRGDAKPSTLLNVITRRRIVDYLRKKYHCSEVITSALSLRYLMGSASDVSYIENIEETLCVNINPLNILILMSQGETKALLMAIKRTRENQFKE